MITKGIFLILLALISFALLAGMVLAANPSGANWTGEVTTTAPADAPQDHSAIAGNVTFLDITGFSSSQSWQGYYGNVSGTIQLADSADKVLYNWSLVNPEGEVYATRNGSTTIQWGEINCFNLSVNHEALETSYNISTDDVDGVNETFLDANSHNAFFTVNRTFTTGECPTAYMFNSTGLNGAGAFEEVMLTDDTDATQVVFASLLEEGGAVGFDGNNYDFEMLVLENGHGNAAATDYYFYIELG